MMKKNRFSKIVSKVNKAPEFMRSYFLTKVFCTQVKYANTSNVTLLEVTNHNVKLTIANKKKVQNHIGGVHAIAAALLAESASGIVFGMNVPDSHLPLLKSMTVDYNKRMQGDLVAVASLSDAQIEQINREEKGDMFVDVAITDESGEEPIAIKMHWAWVPKKRK